MAAPITNLFSITYGATLMGGTSEAYRLHAPYTLDIGHEGLRLVFDVVVVGKSYDTDTEGLSQLSEALHTALRQRDQDIAIDIAGTVTTYTSGTVALNVVASCAKSGNQQTDRGFSRVYTVVIEAELAADTTGDNGLRDLFVDVQYEESQRRIVTMTGTYTATVGNPDDAEQEYVDRFSGVATTILAAIDATASWEIRGHNVTRDRNNHTAEFRRAYVELLANQVEAVLDSDTIRDHRILFTDETAHPGDAVADVYRLRRVRAEYACAVDINFSTDQEGTWQTLIRPHVVALFQTTYNPSEWAVEDYNVTIDPTNSRVNATLTFVYVDPDGGKLVEVSATSTIRETRTIDYTPKHGGSELDMAADPGWATVERVVSRTFISLGESFPISRIAGRNNSGDRVTTTLDFPSSSSNVKKSGWNLVSSTSAATPQWIGDPSFGSQILVTVLSETVVYRLNTASSSTPSWQWGSPTIVKK